MTDDVEELHQLKERAAVRVMLWQLPAISNSEVPIALGVSQTTWQALKLDGDAPDGLPFGRRVIYRTRDLRQWLDEREAKKNPSEEAGVEDHFCA